MLNDLFEQYLTKSEKKSWEPQEIVCYEVYFQRMGHWINKTYREQSDNYPRGMAQAEAKKIAGASGRVFKSTIARQRIS